MTIARALATEPSVMHFDKAPPAQDPELVGEVLPTMGKPSGGHMTMRDVMHDSGSAFNVADRVTFLGKDRKYEDGPPNDVFGIPKFQRTQEFSRSHTVFGVPQMGRPAPVSPVPPNRVEGNVDQRQI